MKFKGNGHRETSFPEAISAGVNLTKLACSLYGDQRIRAHNGSPRGDDSDVLNSKTRRNHSSCAHFAVRINGHAGQGTGDRELIYKEILNEDHGA